MDNRKVPYPSQQEGANLHIVVELNPTKESLQLACNSWGIFLKYVQPTKTHLSDNPTSRASKLNTLLKFSGVKSKNVSDLLSSVSLCCAKQLLLATRKIFHHVLGQLDENLTMVLSHHCKQT